ncbi:MAG: DUF1826 domain-containing protein [Sneathiellales bacterium]|nr:DUF1826 domain-containing protein [Sneathiellales bacterium]
MSLFNASTPGSLREFTGRDALLGVAKRGVPKGANAFFNQLMKHPFAISGTVSKVSAVYDIEALLDSNIPEALKAHSFCSLWIEDMAEISRLFSDIQKSKSIGFWLGTQRGCRRYHADNVPLRMLVTYAGKGTEWLPDFAADRQAFSNGAPNEQIVKDPTALQYMNKWDVAIFRGGPRGLLHRTPDDAMSKPSVMMRLDHASFWENVRKLGSGNAQLFRSEPASRTA